jgi:hypothetical protein
MIGFEGESFQFSVFSFQFSGARMDFEVLEIRASQVAKRTMKENCLDLLLVIG